MLAKGIVEYLSSGEFYVKNSVDGSIKNLEVGDLVNAGDTLISSELNDDLSNIRLVFDDGRVLNFSKGELILEEALFDEDSEKISLSKKLENSDNTLNAWNNLDKSNLDLETNSDLTEEETAAGEEIQ